MLFIEKLAEVGIDVLGSCLSPIGAPWSIKELLHGNASNLPRKVDLERCYEDFFQSKRKTTLQHNNFIHNR